MAALWNLPVVFVCENNLYGISVSVEKTSAVRDIAVRAKGYAIPGVVVDGMDTVAIYEEATRAVKRARSGKGPSLLECKTYRFLGHSRGDPSYGPYRTKEEWESWKKKDPLINVIKAGQLSPEETKNIDREVAEVLEEAVRYAEASPNPDVGTILDDLYA